jgi:hypothetical protein
MLLSSSCGAFRFSVLLHAFAGHGALPARVVGVWESLSTRAMSSIYLQKDCFKPNRVCPPTIFGGTVLSAPCKLLTSDVAVSVPSACLAQVAFPLPLSSAKTSATSFRLSWISVATCWIWFVFSSVCASKSRTCLSTISTRDS